MTSAINNTSVNNFYQSEVAAANKVAPKLIAEIQTKGNIESLDLDDRSLFRGESNDEGDLEVFNITTYNLEDLSVQTKFDGADSCEGIDLYFADDQYVAAYSSSSIGASSIIWNRADGKLIARVSCGRIFAQKGQTLVVSNFVKENDNWEFIPFLWDLSKGKLVGRLEGAKSFEHLVSPLIEGNFIFGAQPTGMIGCWDRSSGSLIKMIGEKRESVKIQGLHIDQNLFITVEMDRINIWDRKSEQIVKTLMKPEELNGEINVSYKDNLLFIKSYEKMELWNIEKEVRVYSLQGERCFSPDEDCLFIINDRSEIEVRDKFDGKLKSTLEGHPANKPYDIGCRSVGRFLVSSGQDGLKIWDKDQGELMTLLSDKPIGAFVVSGQHVIAQVGNTLKMWTLQN